MLEGPDLELEKKAPEEATRVLGSGARFCCLGNYFGYLLGALLDSFMSSPTGFIPLMGLDSGGVNAGTTAATSSLHKLPRHIGVASHDER